MDFYVTDHLSHRALLLDLRTSRASEARSTAVMLSRIAEVDARQLFLQEGYPSMYEFLIHDLNYTEGSAYKRLYAARAAHKFPVLYFAVAEGKLHLSAVVMLSKHLTDGNVVELVEAATHRTKAEIAQLIATRFPRADLPERLEVILPPSPVETIAAQSIELSPGKVDQTPARSAPPWPTPAAQLSPGKVPPARVTPLAEDRVWFQVTIDRETYELLEKARSLLSHKIPNQETELVLKRALELAVAQLEKRKYAVTDRLGHSRGSSESSRHVPASVRRAVKERDGDRCAFLSESGKRCESRTRLEYHHEDPFARGGPPSIENTRLLCAAHNQYEAEQDFGAEFMECKKRDARAKKRA